MQRMPTVVIPGTAPGSSLACVRSLGRHGLRVIVAGGDSVAARSRFCDEAVDVPDPRTDLGAYVDGLLDLAERDDVRTVLPVGEPDARALTCNRDLFAERVATPWPGRTQTDLARDRVRLTTIARAAGVPVPAEAPAPDEPGPEGSNETAAGVETTSDGGQVVDATPLPGEPATREPDAAAARPARADAAELGLFALFESGTPVAWFGFRRERRDATDCGVGAYREAVRDPALRDHGLTLLSDLQWHGPATVHFEPDSDGDAVTLRGVTPWFDDGLPVAVAAGADLPWLHYRLAVGRPPASSPAYEAGVGCHDLCAEGAAVGKALRSPVKGVRAGGRVLASLLGQRNFDYLDPVDLAPFLARLERGARSSRGQTDGAPGR